MNANTCKLPEPSHPAMIIFRFRAEAFAFLKTQYGISQAQCHYYIYNRPDSFAEVDTYLAGLTQGQRS